MVALKHSIPLLVLFVVVFLTFLTSAQCDVPCPTLVPSVCLQVTCQNLTRTGSVDCLNPGAFIPQGTIATYRCIPHRYKDDGNRTYTMMCICDGKWMGIDRFLKFRDWCAANTDTGPFVDVESDRTYLPPHMDQLTSSTSESGRILGGETTNPSVPITTLKFLEAVSTGVPLNTTTMPPEAGTTNSQPETTVGTTGPATTGTSSDAGTTPTTMQPATETGPTGLPSENATTLSPQRSEFSPTGTQLPDDQTTVSPGLELSTGTTGAGITGTTSNLNEGTTPTNVPGQTQMTETATPGQTTMPAGEGVTLSPSAAGNVSSESMMQGKNNSREEGGRSLFPNASNTTTVGPAAGETSATTVPTTGAGGETTATGTGATGSAAGTTPLPITITEEPGSATATAAGTGTTLPPIESGEQTVTPTPADATFTTVAFTTTTHEPPTEAMDEANATGTTASPILVTTTVASLTTTVAPGAESPVAPPETLQNPENATSATPSNATSEGSAPSPGEEVNCGDGHPGEWVNYTDYQLAGLELHNKYRRMHNVSDVKLNQTLNEKAQAWAEHELTEKILRVTPGKRNYAENLYKVSGWRAITPVRAVQEAMKTWYSSVDKYNWTQPNPTGFSQIVWNKTSDIGVGVAKKDDVTVVAVTYWPRGNIILVSSNANQTVDSGKLFRENVFPKVLDVV